MNLQVLSLLTIMVFVSNYFWAQQSPSLPLTPKPPDDESEDDLYSELMSAMAEESSVESDDDWNDVAEKKTLMV